MKFKCLLLCLLLCSGFVNGQSKGLETTGDVLLFVLPATSLSMTLFKGDNQGTWQFTKAFALTTALTYGLKWTLDKPRPDASDNNAFPSGHTSITFQSASFINQRYGWTYGIPAFALAGFTSYSRLNADKHDGWDIVGGIIIGVGSSYLFTTPYQKDHYELSFNSYDNNYLIGFKYKF